MTPDKHASVFSFPQVSYRDNPRQANGKTKKPRSLETVVQFSFSWRRRAKKFKETKIDPLSPVYMFYLRWDGARFPDT
jgi:hypothetical protein